MRTKRKFAANMLHKLMFVAVVLMLVVMALPVMHVSTTSPYAVPTGRVLYLRANGNDDNDGLSLNDAWRTMHHAARQLQPGDTLLVSDVDGDFENTIANGGPRNGDAFRAGPGIPSGTASQPITVMALGTERPVFRSKPTTGSGNAFIHLDNSHHITFKGLSFIDIGYPCPINQPTIIANQVANINGSTNIQFINNIFDNQMNTDFGANPTIRSGSMIQIWGGSDFLLRGNYFNGSGTALVRDPEFPTASGATDMVQMYGAQNVLVEFNYFGNAGHAALLICDMVVGGTQGVGSYHLMYQGRRAQNIVVQFNVIANAWGGGFYFGRSFGDAGRFGEQLDRMNPHRSGDRPGDGGFSGHHLIQNNIVYYIGHQVAYQKFGLTPYGNEGSIIRHNILAYGGDYFGVPNTPLGMTAFPGVYGGAVAPHRHRIFNNVTFRNGSPSAFLSEGGGAGQGGIIRDVEYKNNIFFMDNTPNFARNTMYANIAPELGPTNRPQLEFVAHNTNIDPRTPGRTLQQNFIDHFPSTNRFINNIVLAPEGRPAQVQFWSPPALGGGWVRTLQQVQEDFPLRDRAAIGFPGIMGGFHGNIEVDPMFERISQPGDPKNMEDYSFRLQAGSPAINAGANLTYTSQPGTNTTQVHVRDALYFSCGLGLIPGDPIIVGNNDIVRVIAVDYRYGILTVNRPISYGLGDAVNLPFNGIAPDIGAFMFTEEPEILVDTVTVTGGAVEILGIITSDSGQNIVAFVRNGSGMIVNVARARSMNSGSFRLEIPVSGSGYTITITGQDVVQPTIIIVN